MGPATPSRTGNDAPTTRVELGGQATPSRTCNVGRVGEDGGGEEDTKIARTKRDQVPSTCVSRHADGARRNSDQLHLN